MVAKGISVLHSKKESDLFGVQLPGVGVHSQHQTSEKYMFEHTLGNVHMCVQSKAVIEHLHLPPTTKTTCAFILGKNLTCVQFSITKTFSEFVDEWQALAHLFWSWLSHSLITVLDDPSGPPVVSVSCGKRFTEYSSLYKHHMVHTQQKPYYCTVCARHYRQASTLTMHKRTAHNIVEADDGTDLVVGEAVFTLTNNINGSKKLKNIASNVNIYIPSIKNTHKQMKVSVFADTMAKYKFSNTNSFTIMEEGMDKSECNKVKDNAFTIKSIQSTLYTATTEQRQHDGGGWGAIGVVLRIERSVLSFSKDGNSLLTLDASDDSTELHNSEEQFIVIADPSHFAALQQFGITKSSEVEGLEISDVSSDNISS
uniref:C2H2-type domain-containing protein n=1 Tax=Timema monikensis TaxID=170555 RepID=A0A7R9HU19_9NEOP|nr:unnamed protein product [Timema monikensis]